MPMTNKYLNGAWLEKNIASIDPWQLIKTLGSHLIARLNNEILQAIQPHHPLENALVSGMNMLSEKRHALLRMDARTKMINLHGCFAYCQPLTVSARGQDCDIRWTGNIRQTNDRSIIIWTPTMLVMHLINNRLGAEDKPQSQVCKIMCYLDIHRVP